MTSNQHAGTCRRCKQTVQPGEGWVVGKRGAWTVEHTACTPVADVHTWHCNQGDYVGVCKYGGDDCTAMPQTNAAPSVGDESVPEWGVPIAVDGKRPEWLRDDDETVTGKDRRPSCEWGVAWGAGSVAWEVVEYIRLPASHPYYLSTSCGFVYWPGGDEAPADWDGGRVLCDDGGEYIEPCEWTRPSGGPDIIGYRRTRPTEDETPTDAGEGVEPVAWQRRQQYPSAPGAVPQWEPATQREATWHFERQPGYEYRPLYAHPAPADTGLVGEFREALHEIGYGTAVRTIVDAALVARAALAKAKAGETDRG